MISLLRRMAIVAGAVVIAATSSLDLAGASSVTNHTVAAGDAAIGCITPAVCVMVGTTTHDKATVAVLHNGAGASVKEVPGANDIFSISCVPSKGCVGLGEKSNDLGPVVVTISKTGKVGSVAKPSVPGLDTLKQISCTSLKSCEVMGVIPGGNNNEAFVGTWNGKKIAGLHTVKLSGLSALDMEGLSCHGSYCVAVGTAEINATSILIPIQHGTPGPVVRTKDSNGLRSVDCVSSTTCYVAGFSSNPGGVVLTFHDNKVTRKSTTTASLFSIACHGSSCTAVGSQLPSDPDSSPSAFVGDLVAVSSGVAGAVLVETGCGGYTGVARPGASFIAIGGQVGHDRTLVTTG